MGTISLRYRGVYTGTYPYISYDSIGTAQYDVQPLAFSGFASETGPGRGRFWYYDTGPPSQMIADTSSSLFGVVGGTQTLFGTISADGLYPAVPLYGLGTYANLDNRPLFLTQMEGKTDSSSTTTLTSPNFYLFAGGVAGATTLSGGMQGLYWRPGSAAGTYELGFLRDFGDNPENLDPDLAMWKIAGGLQLQAYRLYDNLASSSTPTFSTSAYSFTNLNMAAVVIQGWPGEPSWVERAREERGFEFQGSINPHWGINAFVSGGTYDAGNPPPVGAQWYQIETIGGGAAPVVGQALWKTEIEYVQSNVFEGRMAVATTHWGDDATDPLAWTSVAGGTIKGQFDPGTSTWQAVKIGTGVTTEDFLLKVGQLTTDAQKTAL